MQHRPKEFVNEIPFHCSVNLGFSTTDVILCEEGLKSSRKQLLASWKAIEKIVKKKAGCHALYEDGSEPWKISTVSANTGIPASLCSPLNGPGAPTMILGGFTMHRISGDKVNPITDTYSKLSSLSLAPNDRVLDTCMGLGYTAIGAAQILLRKGGSGRVTTIEFDEASIEMCCYNPWSQQLFDNSLPIDIIEARYVFILICLLPYKG